MAGAVDDVFVGGQLVYENPSLEEIKAYCNEQVASLWEEVVRFENPHKYYVDFSGKLWGIKQSMIEKIMHDNHGEDCNG